MPAIDPALFHPAGVWLGAVLTGYCFGCLDMAWLLAFYRGLDIKTMGNGNAGASNALMTMGLKSGIVTAAWDIGKSVLAYAFTYFVLSGSWGACVLSAGMAVAGHCFPFWLGFDGGKGFAPFIGFMLCFDWWAAVMILIIGLLLGLLSDRIVAMTFFCAAAWPIVICLRFDWRWALVCAVLSGLLFWRHRTNIKNLARGTEPGIRAAFRKTRPAN